MVVVRQGTTDVKMWLHELYDWEPKDPTDENPVRRLSSILSCKLSMTNVSNDKDYKIIKLPLLLSYK